MKKLLFIIFTLISIQFFSMNLGVYSNGIFLEVPFENMSLKVGYPTFGFSYKNYTEFISFDLKSDFNMNNPQLNNYISTNLGIKFKNLNLYSGLWNTFYSNETLDATIAKIGNFGFFTGIQTNLSNLVINVSLNLKVMNWFKSGDIINSLPAFQGTFEDAVFFSLGLNYIIPLNDNNINVFFNFGANYISFPNGLTLYQFNKNYNFGVLLTLNDLINQEE